MYASQQTSVFNVTMMALVANATEMPACQQKTIDVFSLQFACDVVIGTPLVATGIVANILSFVVLSRQKNRMTTTVLLQALAVCDTLILLVVLLLRSLPNFHILSGTDTLSAYINVHYSSTFVCLFPVMYFLRLTDTWLTTLLTVDRYIAVCHPLQVQRLCTLSRAYKNMAIVFVMALVFSAPRFFEYRLTDENCRGIASTSLLDNRAYTILYQAVLFSVVMYAVPMTLLVWMNWRLLRELRRSNTFRATLSQTQRSAHKVMSAKKSVTLIVVIVVLVCIACNLIAAVTHILWSLHRCFSSMDYLIAPRATLTIISNVVVTLNSAINFFIYCLCSRNFRNEFVATFRCRRMRNNNGWQRGSGRSTNGTQLVPMSRSCSGRSYVAVANGALLQNVSSARTGVTRQRHEPDGALQKRPLHLKLRRLFSAGNHSSYV